LARVQNIVVESNEQSVIPLFWSGIETELAFEITLAKPGASIQFYALLIGKQEQKLTLKINIIHAAPSTTSEVIIKAALSENAQIDINGMIRILPGAKNSNAWLATHILLSENAKGQAIPGLEILENDVKAGHAITISQVSDLEVFYLMSRGLADKKARELVVGGFLQDMIQRFPNSLAMQAKKELVN